MINLSLLDMHTWHRFEAWCRKFDQSQVYSTLTLQSQQNGKKRVVRQVLRNRCKEKIPIFKIMVNLITKKKKNVSMFLETFEFSRLSRIKVSSLSRRNIFEKSVKARISPFWNEIEQYCCIVSIFHRRRHVRFLSKSEWHRRVARGNHALGSWYFD